MSNVKTRFAPSPTGLLHIGNARTALYSWLYSKHYNGKFVLRIEDSDLKRFDEKSIDSIIDGMHWLKLNWDEGPYYQSNNLKYYNSIINEMIHNNQAYNCYCSFERLESLRKKQISNGKKPRYDGYCRNINYHNNNDPHVVRFANPKNGIVSFRDKIRGLIKFKNSELDDLVIRRTNGVPTYNFCVVIDDRDMKITHIIRGEEHINNTPRQINLLKSLKAPIPEYAHLGVILGHDGQKISKRNNDMSILKYYNEGFLYQALLNYLLRLGWSYGNKEIFSVDEMIQFFSFKSINKSSSTFDIKKLLWLNHYYINHLSSRYISKKLKLQIKKENINMQSNINLEDVVKLFASRSKTLKEMVNFSRFFYEDFKSYEKKSAIQYLNFNTYEILNLFKIQLNYIQDWKEKNIENILEKVKKIIKIKNFAMPLRVAITGKSTSPKISTIIYIMGKNKVLERINNALIYIQNLSI
ncbi:MAG: glutamate--tRNA ligase [Arsenophonus sp.]|nr:MAG: glutamate--tRNA ligase [Arsenophonus sp.]